MHCVVVGHENKNIQMKRRMGQQQPTYNASHLYALQVTIWYAVIFNALKKTYPWPSISRIALIQPLR